MKILFIHADSMEYNTTGKAIDNPENLEKHNDKLEEVLVAFISVEKDDECPDNAILEIRQIADNLNIENVMLYPYAHLSSDLASPSTAIDMFNELESGLREYYNVRRAPFGWYKSFKMSCKGHPLAELSRHITCLKKKDEDKQEILSSWYILTQEGDLIPAEEFDFSGYDELKKFYEYESQGSRKTEQEPAHIKLMREHMLVDYESGSDYGNMRWYPKGYLIKRLLEEKVEDMCLELGAMEVETPIMYDLNHPALSKYVKKFPARQYRVTADKGKELFLRFAACFGQYLMAHDMVISYKNLPIRLFELAKSFRKEQHGEVSGIKRLRSFTMPDMHTICMDEQQATEEFMRQFLLAIKWAKIIKIEGEIAIRFVKEFFESHRAFAQKLVNTWGKPVLIEMWDRRYFYFVMKFEINMNDSVGKTFALSTVQIDVENPISFGINFINDRNEYKYPYLLHTSISGGIDRCVCAILEKQALSMNKNEKGEFPFWLNPTQVRLIPVSDDYVNACKIIATDMKKTRVDVDDRDLSVSKKIREAEKEWVSIIIVVGEKEVEGIFKPRYRFTCKKETVTLEQLKEIITEKMADLPFRRLPLPLLLSQRPNFK